MPQRPCLRPALVVLSAIALSAAATAGGACEVREADISFFKDEAKSVALGAKLSFNKVLMREKIDAHVTGGVAILRGNVSNALAIRTAGEVARAYDGVRCVQNHLKVGPPLEEKDEPYTR